MTDARPAIDSCKTSADLRRWYWRKDELIPHARSLGVKTTGGKFAILDRIAHFLDTGDRNFSGDVRVVATSKFDWHGADLTDNTVITDNYRNSQNVRRYFKARLGHGFSFNIAFMSWMKDNVGKTLADAVAVYPTLKTKSSDTKIPHHNQFNQYTRDFMAANPDRSLADVRRVWALKIQQPSDDGRHCYSDDDLKLD
ncbi:MAG: DUF6434 domain-containing protein [Pseudomonadota bacterium]